MNSSEALLGLTLLSPFALVALVALVRLIRGK